MTHNETMFELIKDIQTAIERAHRTIELHEEENGALDRFTQEYLMRSRNEANTFSREYDREMSVEARLVREGVAATRRAHPPDVVGARAPTGSSSTSVHVV